MVTLFDDRETVDRALAAGAGAYVTKQSTPEQILAAVDAARGLMLWDWPARLYDASEAAANDDYCPFGKPAQAAMTAAYRRMREDAS